MNRKADVFAKSVAVIIGVILAVYCISLIYPIFWMFINSLKDEVDYGTNLFNFPSRWMWSNYSEVLKFLKIERVVHGQGVVTISLAEMLYNSLFRCFAENIVDIFFKATCAYVLAKYIFPGSKFIFRLCIVLMIIPIIGNLPSSLLVHRSLGTYDNMYTRLIAIPSGMLGMQFLIFYSAFRGVPDAYMEAAEIDGASRYQIMFKIMLPMQMPLIVTYFVLGFLGTWNDYNTTLIYLPSFPNIAYGLYQFRGTATGGAEGASSAMILAGYALIMIPTTILYFSCHKVITSKIIVGGLKG